MSKPALSLRLTDPVAMALLRARVSGGFMLPGWFFPTMFALRLPGGVTQAKVFCVLLLAPTLFLSLYSLWRGARLSDSAFLLSQCVVQIVITQFTVLNQPVGSLASTELSGVAPVVIAAVFAGSRRHLAFQVALSIVCADITTWHRMGPGPETVPAFGTAAFGFVCVAFVVRMLRDLAHDAVRRAELGEITDPLTGLLNRRGLERTGAGEWTRRAEQNLPLAVILIDIDHFKRVNDTLGHAAGDDLLRHVANRLTELLREGDYAYRLGGEEFAILARCHPGGAVVIAERVRKVIERELPVTVSIGVLEAAPSSQPILEPVDEAAGIVASLWQAVDTADKGLYTAKREGRNRVVAMSGSIRG